MNNEDRHANNYIVRPQAGEKLSMFAFDYSRAWLATGWPLKQVPMVETFVTVSNFRKINQLLGGILDIDAARVVLGNLKNIDANMIETIIDQHPASWLSDAFKADILSFWQNGDALSRIEEIEKGLDNGEYV